MGRLRLISLRYCARQGIGAQAQVRKLGGARQEVVWDGACTCHTALAKRIFIRDGEGGFLSESGKDFRASKVPLNGGCGQPRKRQHEGQHHKENSQGNYREH